MSTAAATAYAHAQQCIAAAWPEAAGAPPAALAEAEQLLAQLAAGGGGADLGRIEAQLAALRAAPIAPALALALLHAPHASPYAHWYAVSLLEHWLLPPGQQSPAASSSPAAAAAAAAAVQAYLAALLAARGRTTKALPALARNKLLQLLARLGLAAGAAGVAAAVETLLAWCAPPPGTPSSAAAGPGLQLSRTGSVASEDGQPAWALAGDGGLATLEEARAAQLELNQLGLLGIRMLAEELAVVAVAAELAADPHVAETSRAAVGAFMAQLATVHATLLDHLATAGTRPQRALPATPRQSPAEAMFASGLDAMAGGAGGAAGGHPRMEFTASSLESAVLALDALAALFAAVPLAEILDQRTFTLLAAYAELNEPDARLGCGALRSGKSCFNEIHQQSLVPRGFEAYVVQAFMLTIELLAKVHQNLVDGAALDQEISEQYVDDFIEYLRVFVGAYQKRLLSDASLPHAELLQKTYALCIRVTHAGQFLRLAELLADFLELFTTDETGQLQATLHKCQPVMVEMAADVCLRTQSDVTPFVGQLDDTVHENEDQPPFLQHVHACARIVAETASLFPVEVVPRVLSAFESRAAAFVPSASALLSEGAGAVAAAQFASREAAAAATQLGRNIAALAIVTARLSYLTVPLCRQNPSQLDQFAQGVVSILAYLLQPHIAGACAAFVAASENLLGLLQSLLQSMEDGEAQAHGPIVQSTLEIAAAGLQIYQRSPRLAQSAANLLFSLAVAARSKQFYEANLLRDCLNFALNESSCRENAEIVLATCGAFVTALYRPWINTPKEQQQWGPRQEQLSGLLAWCRAAVDAQDDCSGVVTAAACLEATASVVARERSELQMTTAQQMRDCIATAVLALPRTARVPAAATAVLRLLMLALRELMPLFGKEWAIELLRTLLSQMQQLQAQGGVGLLSIEHLIDIVVFVLESHERQADDLHNSAISLCLSMLEQAAQPNADIGVVRKVYYFIGRLFVFAWHTLFDDAASRDRFVFLYQTLLGGAERGDPETAMIILQSLDDLASRRRFFEKDVFKQSLVGPTRAALSCPVFEKFPERIEALYRAMHTTR